MTERTPEQIRQDASRAGKACPPEKRYFSRNPEAARIAGAKGGAASKGVKKKRKPKETA